MEEKDDRDYDKFLKSHLERIVAIHKSLQRIGVEPDDPLARQCETFLSSAAQLVKETHPNIPSSLLAALEAIPGYSRVTQPEKPQSQVPVRSKEERVPPAASVKLEPCSWEREDFFQHIYKVGTARIERPGTVRSTSFYTLVKHLVMTPAKGEKLPLPIWLSMDRETLESYPIYLRAVKRLKQAHAKIKSRPEIFGVVDEAQSAVLLDEFLASTGQHALKELFLSTDTARGSIKPLLDKFLQSHHKSRAEDDKSTSLE